MLQDWVRHDNALPLAALLGNQTEQSSKEVLGQVLVEGALTANAPALAHLMYEDMKEFFEEFDGFQGQWMELLKKEETRFERVLTFYAGDKPGGVKLKEVDGDWVEDEFLECPDCSKSLLQANQLLWHRISGHGYRNEKSMAITTDTCVFCNKELRSVEYAKIHAVKYCHEAQEFVEACATYNTTPPQTTTTNQAVEHNTPLAVDPQHANVQMDGEQGKSGGGLKEEKGPQGQSVSGSSGDDKGSKGKDKAMMAWAKNVDARLRTMEGNMYTTFLLDPTNSLGLAMMEENDGYWDAKPPRGTPHPDGHVKNRVMAGLLNHVAHDQEESWLALVEKYKMKEDLDEMVKEAEMLKGFDDLKDEVDWASAKMTRKQDAILVKLMLTQTSRFKEHWGIVMLALRHGKGVEQHGAAPPGPQTKALLAVLAK